MKLNNKEDKQLKELLDKLTDNLPSVRAIYVLHGSGTNFWFRNPDVVFEFLGRADIEMTAWKENLKEGTAIQIRQRASTPEQKYIG